MILLHQCLRKFVIRQWWNCSPHLKIVTALPGENVIVSICLLHSVVVVSDVCFFILHFSVAVLFSVIRQSITFYTALCEWFLWRLIMLLLQQRDMWQRRSWRVHHVSTVWQILLLLASVEQLSLRSSLLRLWEFCNCTLCCIHGRLVSVTIVVTVYHFIFFQFIIRFGPFEYVKFVNKVQINTVQHYPLLSLIHWLTVCWSWSISRGYRIGSPTAIQAWQPCPLWEPSPSHPILL